MSASRSAQMHAALVKAIRICRTGWIRVTLPTDHYCCHNVCTLSWTGLRGFYSPLTRSKVPSCRQAPRSHNKRLDLAIDTVRQDIMQQHRQVLPRQHHTLQSRQSSNGVLWNDILVQPSSLTQCGNITLSWSGGVAPYTLVGNWWESSSGYSDSIARQWVIAQGLPDTTYLFTGKFSNLLVVEAPSDYSRSSCVSRMQPMYR